MKDMNRYLFIQNHINKYKLVSHSTNNSSCTVPDTIIVTTKDTEVYETDKGSFLFLDIF